MRLLKQDDKGNDYVYTQEPCYKSATYLIDRVVGWPTQAIAVDPDAVDVRAAAVAAEQAAREYVDPDDNPDTEP